MSDNYYICEHCRGHFRKGWSDTEAAAEMLANFGNLPAEDQAIICDVCYRVFTAQLAPMGLAGEVHEPHPGECPICGGVHGNLTAELVRCQEVLSNWRPTGFLAP